MTILGIDPGLAIMGYGLISSEGQKLKVIQYGVLSTQAGNPLPGRLRTIFLGVTQLIEMYHPDEIAFEELFFARNVTTALSVGHARGAALAAAAQLNDNLYEYTPLQVKQAVTGWGKADKPQIQQMVKTLLKLDEIPKPDDAADALAVAICHSNSSGVRHLYKIK